MNKLYVTSLLFLVSFFSFSQDLNFNLAVSITPTNTSAYEMNYVNSREDQSGNLITIGTFRGAIDMDPGPGVEIITSNGTSQSDFFVQKLSPTGDYLWSLGFGRNDFDYAKDVVIDHLGNIIITGYVSGNSTGDFQLGPEVLNITLAGGSDVFILKIAPNGDVLWVKTLGSPGAEEGQKLAIDQNNHIIVTGYYNTTFDVDPGPGIENLTGNGTSFNTFLVELDPDGNFVRKTAIKGSAQNFVSDILLSESGNVTLTGSYSGTLYVDPGSIVSTIVSKGGRDGYVIHLDQNWNYLWNYTFGGTSNDFIYSITEDNQNNIYVAGSFHGTTMFQPGVPITSINNDAAYVLKLNSTGQYVYVKVFNGPGNENIHTIDCDAQQNILVGLIFNTSVDVDPGAAVINLSASSNLSYDMCLLKLNQSGDLVWYNQIGGSGSDYLLSIKAIHPDGILISGNYSGAMNVDPNGTHILPGNVKSSFMIRYNQDICSNVTLVVDSIQDISCQENGLIGLNMLNATYPVDYLWIPSQTAIDSTIQITSVGTYSVTATDHLGCERSFSFIMMGPEYLTDFDLNANLVGSSFRTGFPATIQLDAFNDGCSPVSGDLKIILNALVSVDSSTIVPTQINDNELIWSFDDLVYDSIHISPKLFLTVSPSAQIGDTICFQISISPEQGDMNERNNLKTYCFPVINGYDPNDISLNPLGECGANYLLKDQTQTYTIRFQNTGNAEAVNIVVVDTLSEYLDINTFKLIGKSFDGLYTELAGPKVLKFHMDSIMLADSLNNEPESHGYIIYEILPYETVPENTVINNTAEIYFDFNPAVVTNTVSAILVSELPCGLGFSSETELLSVIVYPNPFKDEVNVQITDQLLNKSYYIVDQVGRVVKSGELSSSETIIDMKELMSGWYILKIDNGNSHVKICKQ